MLKRSWRMNRQIEKRMHIAASPHQHSIFRDIQLQEFRLVIREHRQSDYVFITFVSLKKKFFFHLGSHEDYSLGLCGYILLFLSYILICLTFPFSLTVCLKVKFYFEDKYRHRSSLLFNRLFKSTNELLCSDLVVFLVVRK